MGRSIVAAGPVVAASATRGVPDADGPAPASSADPYGDRLLKLIPGEVISLYLSMVVIIENSNDPQHAIVPWVLLTMGAGATYLYLRVAQKVRNVAQLGMSVAAFCVWAIAIPGPLTEQTFISGTYAGMALAAFTFVAPLVPMGEKA